jgi:hypothetical protein
MRKNSCYCSSRGANARQIAWELQRARSNVEVTMHEEQCTSYNTRRVAEEEPCGRNNAQATVR